LLGRKQRNKKLLLDWIYEADFTKEFSFKEIVESPFEIDEDIEIDGLNLFKIMKM